MEGTTAIANILRMEGVQYLFCFPSNPIIEGAAIAGIRPVMARMERTVINMADGFTRTTNGRPVGVCAMQHGPGIENAYGGVAQAYGDSSPLLLLPEQGGRGRMSVPSQYDGARNYQGITKWAGQINLVERIPEMMRRAFTYLHTGRPGPVLLEVPADVAEEELDEAVFNYKAVPRFRTGGDPRDVEAVARVLLGARTPVIYAGQGVLYAEAWDELRELVELLQAPMMTTTLAKSAFPENHPLSLGTGGYTGTKMVGHFLRKADVVFGIGTSFAKTTMTCPVPPGKVMIQSTIDERDLNAEYPLDYVILGDAKLVLRQLVDEVKRQSGTTKRGVNPGVAGEIGAIKKEWLAEWMPRLTSEEVPINPYRVIWELNRTVDRANTIVTHDSGNPRGQMVPFYEALTPRGYLGWGNSTQLGTGLGIAMGAKLAAPNKLVVNVMGDAAVGMAGMDFETPVRERIPILTIILNNSVMGGYAEHFPVAAERYYSNRLSGDYTKLAEALGAYSERVEKPQDIVPAIQRGIRVTAEGRPAVLEMITKEESVFSRYW